MPENVRECLKPPLDMVKRSFCRHYPASGACPSNVGKFKLATSFRCPRKSQIVTRYRGVACDTRLFAINGPSQLATSSRQYIIRSYVRIQGMDLGIFYTGLRIGITNPNSRRSHLQADPFAPPCYRNVGSIATCPA